MTRQYLRDYSFAIFFATADDKGGGGKPEVDTLPKAKARIGELETAVSSHAASLSTLTTERDTARTILAAAESQRDQNMTVAATNARERDEARTALTAAQGQITTLTTERDTARTAQTAAETNVTRLEGLCNLRGISHKNLPATMTDEGASGGGHVLDKWQAASGAAKTQLWRENRAAIRAEGERRAKQGRQ